MYSDSDKKNYTWLVIVVFVLIVVLLAFQLSGRSDLSEDGAEAIRETVRRCALQCYVVEGVYPPNLTYLEENYGLQVNHHDYYIAYEAFASNMPPVIAVRMK